MLTRSGWELLLAKRSLQLVATIIRTVFIGPLDSQLRPEHRNRGMPHEMICLGSVTGLTGAGTGTALCGALVRQRSFRFR